MVPTNKMNLSYRKISGLTIWLLSDELARYKLRNARMALTHEKDPVPQNCIIKATGKANPHSLIYRQTKQCQVMLECKLVAHDVVHCIDWRSASEILVELPKSQTGSIKCTVIWCSTQ